MDNNQANPYLSESSDVGHPNIEKKFSCVCLYANYYDRNFLLGDANTVSDLYKRCSLPKNPNDKSTTIGRREYVKFQECLLQNGYKYSHTIYSEYKECLENWVKES